MEKKILITGAAGFVGFHSAQRLLDQNYELVAIDNFNDYYEPELKRERAALLEERGLRVQNLDICDSEALNALFEKENFTHVLHLAAQAGVRYSLENPQAYVKSNLEGFVNILEGCRLYGSPKLVYASSSSVYGLNEKIPFSELDSTDSPASLYGATKKSNEVIAHAYQQLYKLDLTGLRFFTVYGPWGRPDMAYYSFTKAIEEGKTIDIYNYGKMRRDFTYIDDIVSGIVAALDQCKGYQLFNLGNHQPVELLYFVETLEKLLGKEAKKNFVDFQKGDVLETYANVESAREKLGYFPKTSIEEGLESFVKWYQEYHLKISACR